MIVCLVFAVALPSKAGRAEVLWATVTGKVAGILIGSFLLAGFVWAVSWITRRGMTSLQFMCCFSAGLALLMGSQVLLAVHGETSSRQAQPALVNARQSELPAPPKSNEPVRLWRQQHPDDLRTDDQITMDLAWNNPDAFNTYPDAVADCRRILANEYTLFSQGSRTYDANNPAYFLLLKLVLEQERALQARASWDPSVLLKDGKRFLPRIEFVGLMKTNPSDAQSYWRLSHADVLKSLARLGGVPRRAEVVTNVVVREVVVTNEVIREVPAKLSEFQEGAIALGRKVRFAPYGSALNKLEAVSVDVAVEDEVREIISESSIRQRFELTLRKYGIRVDDKSPAGILVGFSGVWVPPNRVVLACQWNAELRETVMVERTNDFSRAYGTVWADHGGGYAGRGIAGQDMLEKAEQIAEKFANAYLKANPR